MEQRTPEWHAARRGRVTASMAGAILGHSPNMTREAAMRRMVRDWHGAAPEFGGNVATEWGLRNEPGALIEYQMHSGNAVEGAGFLTREEWAGCSPDGLVGIVGGVEVKCPYGLRDGGDFKPIAEQPHYLDQVQFSLWVAQRAWWDFVQWRPGPDGFSVERVTPDSGWRSRNLPKLREFWEDFLAERERPEAHLEPLRSVVDTPDAHRLISEYDDLQEAVERAKERMEEVKEQIVGLAGGRNAMVAGRRVTRIEKAGAVSYAKAIKALCPDADLEPWRGAPSVHWRIG